MNEKRQKKFGKIKNICAQLRSMYFLWFLQ